MPDMHTKWIPGKHVWVIYLFSIILLCILWYYQWVLGIVMTALLIVCVFYTIKSEKALRDETEKYISALSFRLKKAGKEAFYEIPIGIILYNEDHKIEWSNPFMNQFAGEEPLTGKSLHVLSEELIPMIKEKKEELWIPIHEYEFQVLIKQEERLLYFLDRTKQLEIQTLYQKEQTVLAIVFLDNYDEITQNMDDTNKSQLNSDVTTLLNNWAQKYGLYLKRTSQDRFLAVGTREILEQLEKAKFDVLDEVRQLNAEQNIPITLSMGIGTGDEDTALPVLGELAQSGLDLALGRGGDQVAIKEDSGKVRFYGGKTNPVEKRTRVRARVISHAIRGLIEASDNVIIMGHKSPDMDAIGSAMGILNIAKKNGVEGYIVFDPDDVQSGVKRLVTMIQEDESLWGSFIEPNEALERITGRSLLVVVDTNKPSMVADERLLEKTEYKVVIDHHRRGEDFIEDATLVYMEPYASSTAELVTELLDYQPKRNKLKMLEATALLAGIAVDTKGFTLRTGARTFDAASYLRKNGADTVLVQELLKEDLDLYLKRAKLVERSEIYRGSIAIAKAESGEVYESVLIAKTADTLVGMSGINASFVISERKDGKVGISARSLGDINVQIIMEKMGGGGHLTNAATQIDHVSIDEAAARLKEILHEYFEGSETK